MKEKKNYKELEEKLKGLAFDLDKVEDEKLVVQNQLKKALADYHNLLNSIEKREEIRFFQLKKSLCEEALPTLDAVSLAVESSQDMKLGEKEKAWMDGVVGILENLKKVFEGIGLKQYLPKKGDEFDNSIHEAVAVVEEGEKGKIFDVIQPGYMINDDVIRQSRVVVSK